MQDRTLIIHLSGRWLTVVLIMLLAAALVPVTALAAGQFSDDDGNTHEANIEWLASAGITVGCGPGEFCPYQAVTRGQMATFMQRLVDYLGDPNTGKVDDADRLDGIDSTGFVAQSGHTKAAHDALNIDADTLDGKDVTQVRPSAAWWSNDLLPDDNFSVDRTVTVPAGGGTLLMVGSFDFYNPGAASNSLACLFSLDGTALWDSERVEEANVGEWSICATNAARGVTAGSHTVTFDGWGTGLTNPNPHRGTFHVIVIPNA
jgi:hypothetical protein